MVVTGTLRPFVAADFERDYELSWTADTSSTIEAEFNERPVMVAQGIYLIAE